MELILFRGRPGSGKTALSNALGKKLNISILRKDDVYDSVVEFVTNHGDRNKICHDVIYKILETNNRKDARFIVDCPFQHPEDLAVLKDWCNKRGITLKSILVTCSDERVWSERFETRKKNPMPHQLVTDFEEFKKMYGSMQIAPDNEDLVADTVRPQVELLLEIERYI